MGKGKIQSGEQQADAFGGESESFDIFGGTAIRFFAVKSEQFCPNPRLKISVHNISCPYYFQVVIYPPDTDSPADAIIIYSVFQ
jgi:hypothetical protein